MLEKVYDVLKESYFAFALAIPLVVLGLLFLGTIYYYFCLPVEQRGKGFRSWINYLVPKENYRSKSGKIDLWVWLMNGLLFIPFLQLLTTVLSLIAGDFVNQLLIDSLGPAAEYSMPVLVVVVLQFLGSYLGLGFGQYWSHLAFHKVQFLWAIHRAHHSTESANVFAFLRSHPIENLICDGARVVGAALGLGVAVYASGGMLLDETIAALVWYNIVYVIAGGFRSVDHTHSNSIWKVVRHTGGLSHYASGSS